MKNTEDRDYIITAPEADQQWGLIWNKYPNRSSYSAWGNIKNAIIQNVLNDKKINYDTITEAGFGFSDSSSLKSCVRAENGKLVYHPWTGSTSIVYDPIGGGNPDQHGLLIKGDMVLIDPYSYSDAVLLPNGIILFIPYNEPYPAMLDITVEDGSITECLRPQFPGEPDPNSDYGQRKYSAGVLLMDGRVYCVPYDSAKQAVFDFLDQTINKTGYISSNQTEKYSDGVLLDDGRVLCIPYSKSQPMIYNPVDETNYLFGTPDTTAGKYGYGVLLIDGRVLAIPKNATQFAIIDIMEETITPFGPVDAMIGKYSHGVLLPDGRVIAIPYNASRPVIIDPLALTVTPFGTPDSRPAKYSHGILMPDGTVFVTPSGDGEVVSTVVYHASNNDYGVLPDSSLFLNSYINR